MATSEKIPIKTFLESVRRHPEIWATMSASGDRRRVAAAWKRVCLDTWPDFDSWTADQKQKRCLDLQVKWKSVKAEFLNAHESGNSSRRSSYYHLLSFLIPVNSQRDSGSGGAEVEAEAEAGVSEPGPVKRARNDPPEDSLDPDDHEDRHFLLSLVSYMRDVPRASKLALREDVLRLVRKYTPASNGTVHNN